MARVAVLVPDLLFGSRLLEGLGRAGHDARLVAGAGEPADVLVADLTADGADPAALAAAAPAGTKLLGVYAHVDVAPRRAAEAAGFDLVVPRSRMHREGGALVTRLAGG